MTYEELKTKIASFMNRGDLTSELDTFIDQTEGEINRILKHKDMIKRSTATADSQFMQLAGDFISAINVEILTNEYQPLFQQSLESLDTYRKSTDDVSGLPKYYAIVGDTLELCPTPDQSYSIQLTYYANIDGLSATNTSNFVSTTAPDVYLYGCCKHASIFLMEDDRVVLFSGLFDKALEELRLQQERAAFGKNSLIQRRRTYGNVSRKRTYFGNN